MQERVAERARHRRVDLRDHEGGPARRRERDADRDAEAQIAARIRRRAVNQDAVRRPGAAGRELRDEIEVADRDELDAPAPARLLEPRRHVPRREAEGRVLRPRPRVVAEVNTAEQGQVAQPRRLATDLGDEPGRLSTRRRQEHLHRRPEPGDRVSERGTGERARHESRRYIYPIPG